MKHILFLSLLFCCLSSFAQHTITFRLKGSQKNNYLKDYIITKKPYGDILGTTDSTGCITLSGLKPGDTIRLAHQELIPFRYIVPVVAPTAPVEAELKVRLDIEEPAEFEGGRSAMNKFLMQNLHYPERAVKEQIEGKVYLSFVIGTEGQTSDIKIFRSIPDCPECSEEAIRIIKLGKWTPAKAGGKPVSSYFNLPIVFKLN